MSFSSMHNNYLDPDKHLWDEEPPECFDDMRVEMGKWFSIVYDNETPDKLQESIKRDVYKFTSSGCWLEFDECAVRFAGYVEGWDGEIPPTILHWPFTQHEFFEALDSTDKEACTIFDEIQEDYHD